MLQLHVVLLRFLPMRNIPELWVCCTAQKYGKQLVSNFTSPALQPVMQGRCNWVATAAAVGGLEECETRG